MSQRLKALERAENSPRGWTSAQLIALVAKFGFEDCQATKHHEYESPCDRSIFVTVTRSSGELSSGYVIGVTRAIRKHLACVQRSQGGATQ